MTTTSTPPRPAPAAVARDGPVVPPPDHPRRDAQPALVRGVQRGDVEAMMAMYEPDAVLVPGPDAPPVRGRRPSRSPLRGFLGLGGTLSFTPRFWFLAGELALGSIAFVLEGGRDPEGNPVPLAGVTSEVVRRQRDGSWR